MFKQKKTTKIEGPGAQKPMAPSIISADLSINGNLTSDGDIQVDGTVEGDIVSKKLTVSSSATVRGAVEAETVVIAGSITGQIKAQHVTLIKTARVIADVVQERLSIEPGAFFEGNCRHFPGESETRPTPKLEPIKPAVPRRDGDTTALGGARPAAVAEATTS